MLLLKKAFPIRNRNTSSFIVSFISCKAQWCTPPARLAGEVPGVGQGVRQPDLPPATPGSHHHSSHHLWGAWNAIGKKSRCFVTLQSTFLPSNAFSYFSRSDTVIFLLSSQKEAVESWTWSMVLFTRWLPSAYFHPLHTELSWHCACVCLVWWKSPGTGT